MSKDLVCTFCGGRLRVYTRYVGGEDVPDSIDCDGDGCYASWKPDGTYETGGKHDD